MKRRCFSIFLIIFGALFVIYDIICLCLDPMNFVSFLISFSHVWLIPGGFLIFCGIYEIKNERLFCSIWKKWIKILVCVLVCLVLLISGVNLTRMSKAKWADKNVTPDYVILLGGGIDNEGNLPDSVKNRVKTAANYLNEHKDVVCVVSGGKQVYKKYSEAPALKAFLIENGVEENRILADDKALDTIQNLENSAELFAEYDNIEVSDVIKKNVVLVTSRFHVARAERIAKRMGFENVYGVGSKVPFIRVLNCYSREILSYVKLDLRILLTGKPRSII